MVAGLAKGLAKELACIVMIMVQFVYSTTDEVNHDRNPDFFHWLTQSETSSGEMGSTPAMAADADAALSVWNSWCTFSVLLPMRFV